MVEKTSVVIICISGKAQHGKDTFANFFKERVETTSDLKVAILHYADSLKMICSLLFGYNGNKADPEQRKILQRVGSDVVRVNRPDAWVNIMKEIILGIDGEFDIILIPDTRFPNEIKQMDISSKNTFSYRIIRPNFSIGGNNANHVSETALDDFEFSNIVYNDSTLEDYKEKVSSIADFFIENLK